MHSIPPEQLLPEIEDVIQTMPPRATIRHETPENLSWLGRASAVVYLWDSVRALSFDRNVTNLHETMARDSVQGFRGLLTMLHQLAHELRLRTVGPLTVAVARGGVFDYFDEVRKVIEGAKTDPLFVDPYLDVEFVSRYLPHVSQGVIVRLLGRERTTTFLPAVELVRQQTSLSIEVRSAPALHDCYVFVDKQACYQSGSSFRDGAKKAPTTITQIIDAFTAVANTYEQAWSSGMVCK